ncbi:DUF4123 domain-containing protein [Epibacterium sp. Ofav1-8]|uniref:DUF4123 domain-containing protein n=1 Tax=Epibacterium sp. Ofav1-8 TaxID=2917735 RepID=UPI001EF609C8|nr:DUF4123 domain-containing protein [Epibacterium sp. Ofav1-8]MCG7625698.1 DUF4123 domain-containing protein [Epibacterium sp. Ofav1-8]
MNSRNDSDDYWTAAPGGPKQMDDGVSTLKIEQISELEPLDSQIGIDPPKSAPDALAQRLFGKPALTTEELESADGDPTKVPEMHTYVILDASKVTNLPEMLETSGLEHRCFFKGQVFEELNAVAPWLVRLEENNAFCRGLFTKSDAPWHLWGRNFGLFIRSRLTFDRLWQHLRKFTKIEGETSSTSLLRYWEVNTLEAFVAWPEMFPAITKMLNVIFAPGHLLFHANHYDSFFQIDLSPGETQKRLPEGLRGDLKRARFYSNMFDQADDFFESYPVESARYGEDPEAMHRPLFEAVNEIYASGLQDPQLRARFLLLAIIKHPQVWPALCQSAAWQAVRSDPENADVRFRDLCAVMKHYSTRRNGALKTWW